MKPITLELPRFEPMHSWANRILRIDLSDMRISAHEAAGYIPTYLGARGIAARICWDEYPEPVEPFDPANPLMIFPGALTGSSSPYSGRTNVCGFSPQAYPYPWFTRSSVGAHFGGELKRAGYDGLIVTGASETPVRIRIRDDEVSILPADDLWGQDALDALESLESMEGKGTRSLAIGQAGEHLSHIATIQAGSSSACGQGGFGGVMGSKKLKAISVRGSGRVTLAQPQVITQMARALTKERRSGPAFFGGNLKALNQRLAAQGNGSARCLTCTESCVTPCQAYFQDVPGAAYNRKWNGAWFCISALVFPGYNEGMPASVKEDFDWHLEWNAAFEMNVLTNRYGLNQFDLLVGMVPWLIGCQKAGLISEMNGREMDWCSPQFWAEFLRAIAYREGLGDTLAQGGWAAARTLRMGEELAQTRYPGWGQPAHWDGHQGSNHLMGIYPFPYWLVSALQWLADTRDPYDNGHGYTRASGMVRSALSSESETERAAAIARARAIGERVYGDADALDPYSGYKAKAYPGYLHTLYPVIKDLVPVDDLTFPRFTSGNTPDGYCLLSGIEGVGDVEGPAIEYHLFKAGTGIPWSQEEFNRAAERVLNLERALLVRHWGRDRKIDEMVLPFFEQEESFANPLLGEKYGLDRRQFKPVLDEFYTLHGWDTERGWPTYQRLSELDLEDVYEPMVEGAARP